MQTEPKSTSDVDTLRDLNRGYIRAVQTSDVSWFNRMLADDFRCSLPDGSLINRERFLERAALSVDISDLEAHDVEIRVFGDAAVVHARTTFSTSNGRQGSGRYTDIWCRQEGRWLAVAAHVTRKTD